MSWRVSAALGKANWETCGAELGEELIYLCHHIHAGRSTHFLSFSSYPFRQQERKLI